MSDYLVVGMSHIECLDSAWDTMSEAERLGASFGFVNVSRFRDTVEKSIDLDSLNSEIESRIGPETDLVFLFAGNEHNIIGLCDIEPFDAASTRLQARVRGALRRWFGTVKQRGRRNFLMFPPPPNGSEAHIRRYPGSFKEVLDSHPIRTGEDRLRLWELQCSVTREFARSSGFKVIESPASVFGADGYLATDCHGRDPTHGNLRYGQAVIRNLLELGDALEVPGPGAHPYASLPDYSYWHKAVSAVAPGALEPMLNPKFRIRKEDRVATAGSCFAQHISKRLRASGFNYFATERDAGSTGPTGDEVGVSYDFSARYGNIYTARQLAQLLDRAFGYFRPLEGAWETRDGRFCDPFRPRIREDGFASETEVAQDRRRHLAAVRRMFRQLDVFVFTLGLTECWVSRLDGAAYPIAPGVAGGTYDLRRHAFVNFGVQEVVSDLDRFIGKLGFVNPGARVLLTVSPVPLMATYEERHVLLSTVYSKSVLRVAVEEVRAKYANVEYFPSYELINGPHTSSDYFAGDCRSIRDEGVDHVMRAFMTSMTEWRPAKAVPDEAYQQVIAASEAACDEELYGRDDYAGNR